KKILNRLKRIEGQIRGLQRMVENDAPCVDILTQLSAATAAMKKAGVAVVQLYLTNCLDKAARDDGEGSLEEFEKALARYISMS
ncbi:MAG: metal-sensitive transcriptional regulator, partial [Deltaproteobacteria bacterium]|nr:metal-sensitive transcriptional regulator [Deltaproteobacteria bacterium]